MTEEYINQDRKAMPIGINLTYPNHNYMAIWDAIDKDREAGYVNMTIMYPNTVRIFLPYNSFYRINTPKLDALNRLLDVCRAYNIKVIPTLFVWADSIWRKPKRYINENIDWLSRFIPLFADNDTILCWDYGNELDHRYTSTGKDGHTPMVDLAMKENVLWWSGKIYDTIKRLAPEQLVMNGAYGWHLGDRSGNNGENLTPGVLPILSDINSFHWYWTSASMEKAIQLSLSADTRPLIIGEYGVPSAGKDIYGHEIGFGDSQKIYYNNALAVAGKYNVGILAWGLSCYDPAKWKISVSDPDAYFGMFDIFGRITEAGKVWQQGTLKLKEGKDVSLI